MAYRMNARTTAELNASAARQDTSFTMTSKFASKCAACTGWMPEGTRIVYSRETKSARHVTCPTTPEAAPVYVQVEIAPQVSAWQAAIDALQPAYEAANAAYRAADDQLKAAHVTAGVCGSCDGTGWIHAGFDSDYPCTHTPGKGLSRYAANSLPEVAPFAKAVCDTRDELERIGHQQARYQREIEQLSEVRKGDTVRVVKGRKVAKGTEGTVKWMGDGMNGTRVGLQVEGEAKLVYTAASNVLVLTRREVQKP